MHSDIISAIRTLPEYLFTPEIARAAIESNNIDALNYIPSRFLTMEMVESLIENNMKTWSSFDLTRLPVEWRTREICEFAFKNNVNNIKAFPEKFISREIAKTVASCGSGQFNILSYIPASLWDAELAYIALNNKTVSGSYKVDNEGDYRRMQVVLRYVPERVKTKSFYLGMFRELKAECNVLSMLIPNKYKNKTYYMELAKRDLSLVPEQYISYEALYYALLSEYQYPYVYRSLEFKRYLPFLDDLLADRLATKAPYMFSDLPQQFQTPERLIIAIESEECTNVFHLAEDIKQQLLTPEVCKAFIRKNSICPKFPDNVWTQEFVDYCMEHGTSFRWFRQMPQRFQTSANTQAAFDYCTSYVYSFAKRFITPQMAKRCYRDTSYKDAVPKLYLEEFKKQTGLPEEFYGGECSLLSLKNAKVDYSYCKIGNTYLALYTKDWGRTDKPYLMMTRAESRYCTPEKVFDVPVLTFHRTWLEKIVSDNDPQFVKPKVDSSLRAVQALCYYGVEKIKDVNRTEIFRNTFMGQTIGYCARRRDLTYHCDECENLLAGMKYKIRGMAVPTILADECVKYSADMLHRKLGFCYAGMTSFATDYGLDMDKSYSIREMRQIVNEIGYKPSLSSYRKELKKLNII